MTNADATHNLQHLIRQAKRSASRLLNPDAPLNLRVLTTDSEGLLARLQSPETLSAFHPFADLTAPSVMNQQASRDNPQPSRNGFVGRSDVVGQSAPSGEGGKALEASASYTASVLNQDFTRLVEQVFYQSAAQRQKVMGVTERQGSARASTVSAAKPQTAIQQSQPLGQGAALAPKDRSAAAMPSTSTQERDKAVSTLMNEAAPVHPVFQQLETLVNYLVDDHQSGASSHPGAPSQLDNAGSATVERASNLAPKASSNSHLADLTQVLIKSQASGASGLDSSNGEARRKQIQSSAQATANALQAVSDMAQRRSHLEPVPADRDRFSGPVSEMADRLKRNPNMNISEQVAVDPLAYQGLSPTMTQRMADALNDYLQEQAERHGVDLS